VEIKADIQALDAVRKKLTVTIPAEDVGLAFEKALKEIRRKASVPGFRKGHTPAHILKQLYAEDMKSNVGRDIFADSYHLAVRQTGIKPVSDPDVTSFELAEGQPMTYVAEVEVRPEIALPDYKKLTLEKPDPTVPESAVDAAIENLRQHMAPLRTVEESRALATGDVAVITFKGQVDGAPLPGGEGVDVPVEIGSRSFIPGFEEALVGMRAGEEKTFPVTFPADYTQKALGGKEATFAVTLGAIKERVLPALDDAFAKDAGDCATMDELKTRVRESIARTRARDAQTELKNLASARLLEGADFAVPPSLAEAEENSMLRDFARRLHLRGASVEEGQAQIEAARAEIKEAATRNVRLSLILAEIASAEGLKVERADIEKALTELAGMQKRPVGEVRREMVKTGAIEGLHRMLLEEKTIEHIVATATGTPATGAAEGEKA
jgi:trigger factor